MKYTASHCKGSQISLMDVVSSIFNFIQTEHSQGKVSVAELKTIPCIPVHAIAKKTAGQFPVLVEPCRVVFSDVKETQPYYPFIHCVPSQLYHTKDLLEELGVEHSVKLKHMQIILRSVFDSSGGMKFDPNTCIIVNTAVKDLQGLLNRNKNARFSKMGEKVIVKELDPLYLPTIQKQVHHVESMVYTDDTTMHPKMEGTGLFLLWTPRVLDVWAGSFCELLPEAIRPKPLSLLCIRRLSTSCKVCSQPTQAAAKLEKVFQISNLSQAMCMVVKHFTETGHSSNKEQLSQEFQKHLEKFLGKLEVRCVKELRIDIILQNDMQKTIASTSAGCHVQEEESSYCIYLNSSVTDMQMSKVRESIAKEIVGILKRKQLGELPLSHIIDFLKMLLCANSNEEIYDFMMSKSIKCIGFEHNIVDPDDVDPKLGDTIHKSWHFRLDVSNNNIFQPQEWVGYKKSDEEYVFAQVVHPGQLRDSSDQPLKPIQIEYVIFLGEDDEMGKTVKAIDLYKFIMGKQPPKPSDPECRELVPFEGILIMIQREPVMNCRTYSRSRKKSDWSCKTFGSSPGF